MLKLRTLPILTLTLAFVTSACTLGVSNQGLRKKLDKRAAFDLECKELEFIPLEETNGYTTSYGVVGCGRRVTYVLNASSRSWVMNVDGGAPTGGAPEDPPPPPPPPPAQY